MAIKSKTPIKKAAPKKKVAAKKATVKKVAAKKTVVKKESEGVKIKFQKHKSFLKVGDVVPAFSLPNQNEKIIASVDLKNKNYVIYFYPKDDTPGCTAQACNLRDNYLIFKKEGFEIFGVSADASKSHIKFKTKYDLPFDLLTDANHDMAKAFGAWGLKQFMGRIYEGICRFTFVIKKGKIAQIIEEVETAKHSNQIELR